MFALHGPTACGRRFARSSQTISVGRCWRRRRPRIRWPVPNASMVTPLRRDDRVPRQTSPRPKLREVLSQQPVIEQLGLDVLQVGAGLVLGVGDDPDIVLRKFRAARSGVRGWRWSIWRRRGGEDVSSSLAPRAWRRVARPASVHFRRRAAEMVGQVFSAPVEKPVGAWFAQQPAAFP